MPMSEKKIDGFDEFEVRHAASVLKDAVELGSKPKLLEAAKKFIKNEQKTEREAIGLADNL